jgi:hypothetical protein
MNYVTVVMCAVRLAVSFAKRAMCANLAALRAAQVMTLIRCIREVLVVLAMPLVQESPVTQRLA